MIDLRTPVAASRKSSSSQTKLLPYVKEEPKTHVEWTVEGDGLNAEIKIVHSGFAGQSKNFHDYNRGWAPFMVNLALYLETGISINDCTGEIKE